MNVLERFIISSAIFIGSIPLFGVLASWLYVFDGIVVLVMSFIMASITFLFIKPDERISKVWVWVGLLFVIFSALMFYGSFKYSYLEDADPYGYAVVAQYITEHNTFVKDKGLYLENYAEPDAIGYSLYMAAWYDVFGHMNFVLKFFNALVISLSLLWFFVFAKEFFQNEYKALFAMFILFVIPSYLTHFIFATSLAVALFFPALYFMIKSKNNYVYVLPAALCISGILITHHLSGFVFGLFFIVYWLFNKYWNVFLCGAGGVFYALIYWLPQLSRYGLSGIKSQLGIDSVTAVVGTADVKYGITHFFIASKQNMINTSWGWGPFVFVLVLLGLLYLYGRQHKTPEYITWVWLVLCLVGVLAVYLPIKLMPFRWWTFLSIPVALIAGRTLFDVSQSKKIGFLLLSVWIAGLLAFSAYPKFVINTSVWGPSASLMHPGVLDAHLFMMEQFPDNTRVFSFHTASKLQGFNMWSCDWCWDEIKFKQDFPRPTDSLSYALSMNNYEFVFVPVSWYIDKFGEDSTGQQIEWLEESESFKRIYQNENAIIYRVVRK